MKHLPRRGKSFPICCPVLQFSYWAEDLLIYKNWRTTADFVFSWNYWTCVYQKPIRFVFRPIIKINFQYAAENILLHSKAAHAELFFWLWNAFGCKKSKYGIMSLQHLVSFAKTPPRISNAHGCSICTGSGDLLASQTGQEKLIYPNLCLIFKVSELHTPQGASRRESEPASYRCNHS